MRPTINLLVTILFVKTLCAQQINIIPQPAEMEVGKGFLTIKQPVGFIYNDDVPGNYGVSFFKDYLKKYYKISQFKEGTEHSYGFPTEIFIDYSTSIKDDRYELAVDKKGIYVHGNAKGLFYAFQTLIQLLPTPDKILPNTNIQIPFVSIKDSPRFAYRGMHLDVGRHFFPVSFIKKYIDYLALHKFNTFHWHLTEDQGWRIEIKKYPKLTQVGAWRNGTIIGRYPGKGNDGKRYGGYYTQAQIKDVVAYAQKRYITILPEIELPGHASAAIAAYPELSCFPNEPTIRYFNKQCTWSGDSTGKQVQQTWGVFNDVFCAGKENTFKFLQDVMDEVLALFPSKVIHVGGDESPKENWKKCPRCQGRMKEKGLKDEHELQSYFIQRMEKYLNSKGRTLIGWDEILEGGLAPKALVMSWRGEEGGIAAAKQNHDVVMTPGGWVYFDHSQTQNEDSVTIGGYTSIEKTYSYEPVPAVLNAQEAKHVLGAQGNVWTEYMENTRKVEYMIFPRMSALSEVLWSPKAKRNWQDFEKRLQTQFKRYDLWKANYSKAYFDLKATILPAPSNSGLLWQLETKSSEPITINFNRGDSIWAYTEPQLIDQNTDAYAHNKNTRITQRFLFNKATAKKITLTTTPSNKYPGDGAFTLVNGVQNEKGLGKSTEFLGFEGPDCEVVIDLGSAQTISSAIIHTLSSGGSWVYPPQYVEIFISQDGQSFTSAGKSERFETTNGSNGVVKVSFTPVSARYIKVLVKNFGLIPTGLSGAGNRAWLFVDEIEVN
ncbi:MAG: family 20 glycosylhydrolase [Chitinophagales bacterium]